VPPLTLTKLRLKAEQGDADAQYNLGFLYANGERVTLDYAEATNWYRKAAEQGDARAQLKLGVLYDHGRGMATSDHVESAKWYRRAAEQGNAEAQARLGSLYTGGWMTRRVLPGLKRVCTNVNR